MERTGPDELEVTGLPATEIGDLAHALGVPVHHLAEVEQSLEHAYLSLTEDSVDYHGHDPPSRSRTEQPDEHRHRPRPHRPGRVEPDLERPLELDPRRW